jgi:G3E family GTPase
MQDHSQRVSHDPDVSTVTLRLSEPVCLEGFKTWMDTLLWEEARTVDIFRIKGLLSVQHSDAKHGVQVTAPVPSC